MLVPAFTCPIRCHAVFRARCSTAPSAWKSIFLSIRAGIVVVNAGPFLAQVGPAAPMYRETMAIMVLSAVYALVLLAFKPVARWLILQASAFHYVPDALFITLWVLATGGLGGHYYILYHLSVASVAIRFSLSESLLAAAVFTVSYAGLVLTTNADWSEVIMPLAGAGRRRGDCGRCQRRYRAVPGRRHGAGGADAARRPGQVRGQARSDRLARQAA